MIRILLDLRSNLASNHLVGESEHTTIGLFESVSQNAQCEQCNEVTNVMHDDNLSSSEKLLRDDDATKRIASSTACVADDMGIALFETEGSSSVWIEGKLVSP